MPYVGQGVRATHVNSCIAATLSNLLFAESHRMGTPFDLSRPCRSHTHVERNATALAQERASYAQSLTDAYDKLEASMKHAMELIETFKTALQAPARFSHLLWCSHGFSFDCPNVQTLRSDQCVASVWCKQWLPLRELSSCELSWYRARG